MIFLADAEKEVSGNENTAPTVSVSVGRETISILSTKQQATSTTVGDECVSYLNELIRIKFDFLR
jgi:hypothetical protein